MSLSLFPQHRGKVTALQPLEVKRNVSESKHGVRLREALFGEFHDGVKGASKPAAGNATATFGDLAVSHILALQSRTKERKKSGASSKKIPAKPSSSRR